MNTPPPLEKPVKSPAEASGVAGSFALLIAHFAGVTDGDTILSMAVVLGFVPGAVTWTVWLFRARRDGT